MSINLYKLGLAYQNSHFIEISNEMLTNMKPHIDHGQSYSNWLRLALYHQFPFYEIAITGNGSSLLAAELTANYIPNKFVMHSESTSSLPLLDQKFLGDGTIFVCVNKTCNKPVKTVSEALKQIQ